MRFFFFITIAVIFLISLYLGMYSVSDNFNKLNPENTKSIAVYENCPLYNGFPSYLSSSSNVKSEKTAIDNSKKMFFDCLTLENKINSKEKNELELTKDERLCIAGHLIIDEEEGRIASNITYDKPPQNQQVGYVHSIFYIRPSEEILFTSYDPDLSRKLIKKLVTKEIPNALDYPEWGRLSLPLDNVSIAEVGVLKYIPSGHYLSYYADGCGRITRIYSDVSHLDEKSDPVVYEVYKKAWHNEIMWAKSRGYEMSFGGNNNIYVGKGRH